jgi:plastocyanin
MTVLELEPGDQVAWTTARMHAVVVYAWPSQVYPEHQVVAIRTFAPTHVAIVLSRELDKLPKEPM